MPIERRTVSGVLGILAGLGLLAWAAYQLITGDVICIDHPMAPGDICDTTSGDLIHRTYDDMRSSQQTRAIIELAAAIAMVALGLWLLRYRPKTALPTVRRRGLVAAAVAVFGLGFAALGVWLVASDVTCGDRVLKPGDSCEVVDHGRVSVQTYTTRHNDHLRTGGIAVVVGLGLAGFCVRQLRKPDPSKLPPLPTA